MTATLVRDVMTDSLATVGSNATIADAARLMRDRDIGDVLVVDADRLCGIVTDRDIVVRALAGSAGPETTVAGACSANVFTIAPDAAIDDAVMLMREHALRRVPVVDGDRPVGIVSIGDLAVENDPRSALGEISAAAPNS